MRIKSPVKLRVNVNKPVMSCIMLCPPTVASPEEGGYIPVSIFIVVVLPGGENI